MDEKNVQYSFSDKKMEWDIAINVCSSIADKISLIDAGLILKCHKFVRELQ